MKNTPIIGLLGTLCLFSPFSPVLAQQEPNPTLSEHIQYPADEFWLSLFTDALLELGHAERFDVRFNAKKFGPGAGGRINVFLFDSSASGGQVRTQNSNNCRYYSQSHDVVCDANFFRLMVSHYGIDKNFLVEDEIDYAAQSLIASQGHTYYLREELREVYFWLIVWVVGHEFGHLHHGHEGTFSMVENGTNSADGKLGNESQLATSEPSIATNYCHDREREADIFFASNFEGQERRIDAYMGILTFFNAAKQMANCPDLPSGYSCEANGVAGDWTGVALGAGVIEEDVFATHPAFMYRVLDVLEHLAVGWDNGFPAQLDNAKARSVNVLERFSKNDSCFIE